MLARTSASITISGLLVPEIWSRMSVEERDPKFLIEHAT